MGADQSAAGQAHHGVHFEGEHRGRTDRQHGGAQQQRRDPSRCPEPGVGQQDQRGEGQCHHGHADDQGAAGSPARGEPAGDPQLCGHSHHAGHHEQRGDQQRLVLGCKVRGVQRQGQIDLEGQHVGAGHRRGEQQEGAVGQHGAPVLPDRGLVLDRVGVAAGQREELGDGQQREHRGRRGGGRPEVHGHERQADQRPGQDAGLVEDVEHCERLHAALPGIGGQVGAHRRVEQRPGETRCRRGDQHHG